MTTRYVNTASTAGGDGTTNGTSGATRAFASLREALTSLPATLTDAVTINCSGSAADTLSCTQTEWDFVTSATNYIRVIGDNTSGKWNTGAYRIEVSNTSAIYNNDIGHSRLENLQVQVTVSTSTAANYNCYRMATANNQGSPVDHRFVNCIARIARTGGTDDSFGFINSDPGGSGGTCKLINCLAYTISTGGTGNTTGFCSDGTAWATSNLYNYNCTGYGNKFNWQDVQICKSCLSAAPLFGDGGGFLSTGSSGHEFNVSDESTAQGNNSRSNQTITFANTGAEDFHLSSSDTGARFRGKTDPASGLYSADIDGTTRTGRWDVGADQVPVSVALTGTATASITESDIVSGGKTVILTVTNDTFNVATETPAFLTAHAASTTTAPGRTDNGALSIAWPTGYAPNPRDFAVIALFSDQGSGSLPTDWSEVTGSPFGAGTEKLNVFYKVLDGTEAVPSTTISGSTTNMAHCAAMVIYTGVGSIGAIGTASNGTGTPMTAGAITTTDDNSIVIGVCGRGDNENASTQTFGGSGTGVSERLDAGTGSGNDAQVSVYDKAFATSGTSSGNGSAATSVTDPWVSVLLELKRSTSFTSARAAIASGLDSAQSESAGWDAKVKPNIPVANVVRTSSTVCTITLQAQSDYNITAQETITATIPATALAGGGSIAALPTFTIAAGGGTTDGAGSAAGTCTVAAVGASTAASPGSATGVGAATAIGASTAESLGSSAGTCTVAAVGAAFFAGVGASDGLGAATGVGSSVAAGVGSTDGVGAASAVGAAESAGAGSIDGTCTVAAVGASTAASVAASNGIASVAAVGTGVISAAGSSDGTATVSGEGLAVSIQSGAGASDGVGTAAGIGTSTAETAGSSAGEATATGIGASAAASAGTSSGIGEALGTGASIAAGVGASDGSVTVSGVGDALTSGSATGQAAGTSTAVAVGASTAASSGTAAGTCTVSGVGASIVSAVGAVSAACTAAAVGTGVISAAGESAGTGTTAAIGVSTWEAAGSSAGTCTVAGSSEASTIEQGAGLSTSSSTALAVGSSVAATVGLAAGICTVAGISVLDSYGLTQFGAAHSAVMSSSKSTMQQSVYAASRMVSDRVKST